MEVFFLKVFDLFEEIKVVKNEFKEVIEVEMMSKKVMDDFVLVLKEVVIDVS